MFFRRCFCIFVPMLSLEDGKLGIDLLGYCRPASTLESAFFHHTSSTTSLMQVLEKKQKSYILNCRTPDLKNTVAEIMFQTNYQRQFSADAFLNQTDHRCPFQRHRCAETVPCGITLFQTTNQGDKDIYCTNAGVHSRTRISHMGMATMDK